MTTRLVAYVLTRDEEVHIADAIHSLHQVTDRLVVVDSLSSDRTCEIARQHGAEVWERRFDSFSAQRNWAIDRLLQEYGPDWILQLDADERLTAELVAEVKELIARDDPAHDAFLLPLQTRFAGKLLRFGGFSRTQLMRLFRPSAGRYEERDVNEHFVVAPTARLGTLQGALVHEDVKSWERHIAKHNRYSTLEAEARWARQAQNRARLSLATARKQRHLRRRWLREQIWDRLPARPAVRFFQVYVLGGGFLDGSAGFRIALFHAWQEMCTDLKYENLVVERGPCAGEPGAQ
jgi:glycosyltransferase involved in cell wall biosynthesis